MASQKSLKSGGNRGRMRPQSSRLGVGGGDSGQEDRDQEGPKSRPFSCFVGFPTDDAKKVREVEELLLCVRCKKVPNPKYYFTCDVCDLLLCGSCAYLRVESDENPRTGFTTCCSNSAAPIRGSERFLNALLQNSYWECENKGWSGCEEGVRGFDWVEHMKACKLKEFRCYFSSKCTFKCNSKEGIINHLTVFHGCPEFGPYPNGVVNLTIPFDETAKQDRHLALVKTPGGHYIFGSEIVEAELHMWVWGMDMVRRSGSMKCFLRLKPVGDPKDGEIQYCTTCLSYEVPPEQIVDDGGSSFSVGVKALRKKYLWPSGEAENVKYWRVALLIKEKMGNEGDDGTLL